MGRADSDRQLIELEYESAFAPGKKYMTCASVSDYPSWVLHNGSVMNEENEILIGGLEKVISDEEIFIFFDYPLNKPVMVRFANKGGWTRFDLYRAVYTGYKRIYDEEKAAVGDPGHISGMLNRRTSTGPYGIWGHDMSDLFLEAIHYTPEKRLVELGIGS